MSSSSSGENSIVTYHSDSDTPPSIQSVVVEASVPTVVSDTMRVTINIDRSSTANPQLMPYLKARSHSPSVLDEAVEVTVKDVDEEKPLGGSSTAFLCNNNLEHCLDFTRNLHSPFDPILNPRCNQSQILLLTIRSSVGPLRKSGSSRI